MLYDPKDHPSPEEAAKTFTKKSKLWERFMKIKQSRLLKPFRKKVGNRQQTIPRFLKAILPFILHLTGK
jgi:hypothetical protein